MTTAMRTLTNEEVEHFLEHGYVHVRNAIPREIAMEEVKKRFAENGMDADRPETWTGGPLKSMKGNRAWPAQEIAPRFWGAACELLGGVERLNNPTLPIDNGMTANLNEAEGKPWVEPGITAGWHKDGQFFRHFLDSPEQALLALRLWSDVVSRGGATYFAPESVGEIARFLAAHPEGVHPNFFPCREMIARCPRRLEAVGEAGDVYLMHGFMLHTVAPNPNRKLRCISNGIVALKEPMNFNRENPADFSLLERSILRHLGVERLDFKPTRERVRTPDYSVLPREQK